jgi:hypothetical protein
MKRGIAIAGLVVAISPFMVVASSPAADLAPSFSFSASGDHGGSTDTTASLDALASSASNFHLALGDLSYGEIAPESAWCDHIKSRVGATYPFELLSGNHEDNGPDGSIVNFEACLPDRLGNIVGRYSRQYYFDYPAAVPLARFILISPNLSFPDEGSYSYLKGTTRYQWVSNTIDAARTAGIPWVIVGMHKNCITAGEKTCEIKPDLMNLLISKKVDLILQGHEHSYQRSKQLGLSAGCTAVPVGVYNADCVVDDGSDGTYLKDAGPVMAITGTFGHGLYPIFPDDPEAPYFARSMGINMNPTFGFMRYEVSAQEIRASFVR